MEFGRYDVRSMETGRLRLDGGAMFGVVPRVMWEKVASPDEMGRIQLYMRSLLVRDRRAGRVILVDTGAGTKWSPKEIERYGLEVAGDGLGAGLASAGLREEDVTDILITHLHFDHNGGLTRWADQDREQAVPRFPRARVWVHRKHWDHAVSPSEKDRASFMQRDFGPVLEAGLVETLEGDPPASPFEGISLQLVHGHTPGQMLPRFVGDGRELLYTGDLIPMFTHLPVSWVMAYDVEPLRTIVEKKLVLRDCAERNLLLAPAHDPGAACGAVDMDGKRPVLREAVQL